MNEEFHPSSSQTRLDNPKVVILDVCTLYLANPSTKSRGFWSRSVIQREINQNFGRYSGVTTPKTILPGSMKKNSKQITHSFFPTLPNLRGEIPLKVGRFVTPTSCNVKILPS
jgi:hypothetical protein